MTLVVYTQPDLKARLDAWRKAGGVCVGADDGGAACGAYGVGGGGAEICGAGDRYYFCESETIRAEGRFRAISAHVGGGCRQVRGGGGGCSVCAGCEEEVYPPGDDKKRSARKSREMLEGEFRPGFFDGVATVLERFFYSFGPMSRCLGRRSQQLQVVKQLVKELGLPIEVFGAPTRREPDGLAMSSRNVYLKCGGTEDCAAHVPNLTRDGRRRKNRGMGHPSVAGGRV